MIVVVAKRVVGVVGTVARRVVGTVARRVVGVVGTVAKRVVGAVGTVARRVLPLRTWCGCPIVICPSNRQTNLLLPLVRLVSSHRYPTFPGRIFR